MTTLSALITPDLIASSMTYDQYVALSAELLAQGQTTSDAPNYNTPQVLGYAKLNIHRMSRLGRLTAITPELKAAIGQVQEPWTWLVLTESWCGDAAQSVPVLHRMAEESPFISLKFLLRDKNLPLMDTYLTNGGRSIPKLICLRTTGSTGEFLQELGAWGPRPAALQTLVSNWRAEKLPADEWLEKVQRWYNEDRSVAIQAELLSCVQQWAKVSV